MRCLSDPSALDVSSTLTEPAPKTAGPSLALARCSAARPPKSAVITKSPSFRSLMSRREVLLGAGAVSAVTPRSGPAIGGASLAKANDHYEGRGVASPGIVDVHAHLIMPRYQ